MNKIRYFFLLLLAIGFSAQAEAGKKEGYSFYLGKSSHLSGTKGKKLFGEKQNSTSFGGDYTTKNGIIFGASYADDLVEIPTYSFLYRGSVFLIDYEASALSLYVGKHFRNDVRFTGGITTTSSKHTVSSGGLDDQKSDNSLGLNLGIDYIIKNNFLVGARLNQHKYKFINGTSEKNTLLTFNLGYKF